MNDSGHSIDALVFDIGGVLVKDVWEHLLLDPVTGVAAICGLDFDEVAAFAPVLWHEFEIRPCSDAEPAEVLERLYWERFCSRFPVSLSIDDLIALTDDFISPVNGMTALLEKAASRNIPMAICSNNNEFWLRKQVDKAGLAPFFPSERIISSSCVGAIKNSPGFEMFRAVTAALQTSGSGTVFIDDRFENIIRCQAYGWTGILFPQADPHGAAYLESLLRRMGW
ncbi:HAD hydrolase-like protein [candidate division KSB1 bacterium]|nr:HAD hydrolase-like protein [candidate division KSB1 bacterium]